MFKQGVLPFRYECEPTESGMTALAGLPAYLELAIVSGLTDSIQRHLGECAKKEQGWTDTVLFCLDGFAIVHLLPPITTSNQLLYG